MLNIFGNIPFRFHRPLHKVSIIRCESKQQRGEIYYRHSCNWLLHWKMSKNREMKGTSGSKLPETMITNWRVWQISIRNQYTADCQGILDTPGEIQTLWDWYLSIAHVTGNPTDLTSKDLFQQNFPSMHWTDRTRVTVNPSPTKAMCEFHRARAVKMIITSLVCYVKKAPSDSLLITEGGIPWWSELQSQYYDSETLLERIWEVDIRWATESSAEY